MSQPTGIEALVCADIAARQKLGIAKYGRTVAESSDDMLQHGLEEALDLAVYLKAEIVNRRWVDVITRLPNEGEWVLHSYYGVRRPEYGLFKNGRFWRDSGPEAFPATHWLRIPMIQ